MRNVRTHCFAAWRASAESLCKLTMTEHTAARVTNNFTRARLAWRVCLAVMAATLDLSTKTLDGKIACELSAAAAGNHNPLCMCFVPSPLL